MRSGDLLRLFDRGLRVGLAAQALLVLGLTVLWNVHVRGWIGINELVTLSGPSAGWDIRLGLTAASFTLFICLSFSFLVLVVRSILLIFGLSRWGLSWWVGVFALQLVSGLLFAATVA